MHHDSGYKGKIWHQMIDQARKLQVVDIQGELDSYETVILRVSLNLAEAIDHSEC